MTIYGIGYMIIYTIFFLLYVHALRQKVRLQLTPPEIFDTRTKIFAQVILISIGLCSILLALILPERMAGLSGVFYMAIGPAFWWYYSRRGKIKMRTFA
jgi:hypothetical protein